MLVCLAWTSLGIILISSIINSALTRYATHPPTHPPTLTMSAPWKVRKQIYRPAELWYFVRAVNYYEGAIVDIIRTFLWTPVVFGNYMPLMPLGPLAGTEGVGASPAVTVLSCYPRGDSGSLDCDSDDEDDGGLDSVVEDEFKCFQKTTVHCKIDGSLRTKQQRMPMAHYLPSYGSMMVADDFKTSTWFGVKFQAPSDISLTAVTFLLPSVDWDASARNVHNHVLDLKVSIGHRQGATWVVDSDGHADDSSTDAHGAGETVETYDRALPTWQWPVCGSARVVSSLAAGNVGRDDDDDGGNGGGGRCRSSGGSSRGRTGQNFRALTVKLNNRVIRESEWYYLIFWFDAADETGDGAGDDEDAADTGSVSAVTRAVLPTTEEQQQQHDEADGASNPEIPSHPEKNIAYANPSRCITVTCDPCF